MTWQMWSVLPVWVASIAAAVIVGVLVTGPERLTWIGISFAGAIIATFAIQLATSRIDGYVMRAMASIGGALVIFAVATGVFALLS